MGIINIVRLVVIIAVIYIARILWCKKLLSSWLQQQGLEVKNATLCILNKGPFTYKSGGRQLVFWVVATNQDRRTLKGHVRTRGLVASLFKKDFEVIWENLNGKS